MQWWAMWIKFIGVKNYYYYSYYFEWTKQNEWCDKESHIWWIFLIGPDYFFTENKYSWISHANLARCWSRSSIISSSTVFDLCSFCMSCDDSILNNNNYPWKSLNSIFIVKLNLLTISVTFSWFYKIKNIGDVAGWNRLKVLILVEISVQSSWKYYLITKL